MAIMWPRKLPSWVMQDPRRAAEREVYAKLDLILDDQWSVYYSRPWWGISKTGAEVDGEADFVLAHPDMGILFLEIKGGLVEHDPKTSQWTSKDRDGIRHKIKDPVQQSMKAKYGLLEKMKLASGWPNLRVKLRHGVVFPDCDAGPHVSIAGYDRELFCLAVEFRDSFSTWIHKRLATHCPDGQRNESGPGEAGIAAIDSAIAAPARLSVPLHRQISAEIAEQDELLSGAQLLAITSIDAYPKAVVEGGAGTGKTLIACEMAMRYARSGKSALLCCLSDALASSLKLRTGKHPMLTTMTLQEVTSAVATGELPKQDAVLVDEGQDVDWQQWDMIENLIANNGVLRVMFDSNQALYRARDDLETRLGAIGFPLRLNLRNTQSVARITERLYRGPLISCVGPKGQPVVQFDLEPAELPDAALRCVQGLIVDQKLSPEDVTVLVPSVDVADSVKSAMDKARLATTDAVTCTSGAIIVDTIARFKGLEAPVIVIATDRLAANSNELSYVAVSRARSLLIVLGPTKGTMLGDAMC